MSAKQASRQRNIGASPMQVVSSCLKCGSPIFAEKYTGNYRCFPEGTPLPVRHSCEFRKHAPTKECRGGIDFPWHRLTDKEIGDIVHALSTYGYSQLSDRLLRANAVAIRDELSEVSLEVSQ